jgi:choline-sulfatase
VWIDPETRTFVVILTSRLHPDREGKSPVALRRSVGTAVAAAITEVQSRGCITRAAGRRPPNVLVLVCDDHAAYTLGVDGDPHGATPHLDALARGGTYFSRAYCASPVCTASRQAFLTGRYPHANGVTVLTTPLAESAVTMADWLMAHGYDTAAIGKMHFNSALTHGFALRVDHPDWAEWLRDNPAPDGARRRPWRPFADEAAVWLNADAHASGLPGSHEQATYYTNRAIAYLKERRDRPFFLVLSYQEPHSPFVFPTDWRERYESGAFGSFMVSEFDRSRQPKIFAGLTDPQARGIRSAYYTSLRYVDSRIGAVLGALRDAGLETETIVIYWGDNGYLLGQHGRFEKHVLYEEAVRVPLIVRWPGVVEPGRVVAGLVETIDVFPTLSSLLGIAGPPGLQGRGFERVLHGSSARTGRDAVFSEYLENEEAMLRTERYKLIVGSGKRHRQDGYETTDPTPGAYEHLYDLRDDPREAIDLSARADLAEVRTAMRERLLEVFARTWEGGAPEGVPLDWYLVPRDAPPIRSAEAAR